VNIDINILIFVGSTIVAIIGGLLGVIWFLIRKYLQKQTDMSKKIAQQEGHIRTLQTKIDTLEAGNEKKHTKFDADIEKIHADTLHLERETNERLERLKDNVAKTEREIVTKINDLEVTVSGVGAIFMTRAEFLEYIKKNGDRK
jgi:SMC interacting uncharacterized protein involved in chromosome segregation